MQSLIVALLVAGCSVYAAWTLMPAAARRALATRLLRLPVPARLRMPLERALKTSGSCGDCDSCGPAAPKPITIHRR